MSQAIVMPIVVSVDASSAVKGGQIVEQMAKGIAKAMEQANASMNKAIGGSAVTANANKQAAAIGTVTKALNKNITQAQLAREHGSLLANAWNEGSKVIDNRYLKSLNGLKEGLYRLGKEFETTSTRHNGYVRSMSDMDMAHSRFLIKGNLITRYLDNTADKWIKLGKNAQWTGRQLMVGVTAPLVAIGATSVKAAMQVGELDLTLKRVLSTASSDDFKKLDDQTRQLSETFGVTRVSIKEMQSEFARVGFSIQAVIDATKQASQLSILGKVDTKEAQKLVQVLYQSGEAYKTVQDQIEKFLLIDQKTNMNIKDTTAALADVYPTAKQFGLSMAETAAYMAGVTQGGLSAADAARVLNFSLVKTSTALANIFAGDSGGRARLKNLQEQLTMAQKITGQGISLFDTEGNQKGAKEMLGELAGLWNKLDKIGTTRALALKRQLLTALYNTTEATEGGQLLDALSKSMDTATSQGQDLAKAMGIASASIGTFAQEWSKQLGVVGEDETVRIQGMLQKIVNTGQDIGKKLIPYVVDILENVRKLIDAFENLPDGVKKGILTLLVGLSALGPVIYSAGQAMIVLGTTAKGMIFPFLKLFGITKTFGNAWKWAPEAEDSLVLLNDAFSKGKISISDYKTTLKTLIDEASKTKVTTEGIAVATQAHTSAAAANATAVEAQAAAQTHLNSVEAAGIAMKRKAAGSIKHEAFDSGAYLATIMPGTATPRSVSPEDAVNSLKNKIMRRNRTIGLGRGKDVKSGIDTSILKPGMADGRVKELEAIIQSSDDQIKSLGTETDIRNLARRLALGDMVDPDLDAVNARIERLERLRNRMGEFKKAWGYDAPVDIDLSITDPAEALADFESRFYRFSDALRDTVRDIATTSSNPQIAEKKLERLRGSIRKQKVSTWDSSLRKYVDAKDGETITAVQIDQWLRATEGKDLRATDTTALFKDALERAGLKARKDAFPARDTIEEAASDIVRAREAMTTADSPIPLPYTVFEHIKDIIKDSSGQGFIDTTTGEYSRQIAQVLEVAKQEVANTSARGKGQDPIANISKSLYDIRKAELAEKGQKGRMSKDKGLTDEMARVLRSISETFSPGDAKQFDTLQQRLVTMIESVDSKNKYVLEMLDNEITGGRHSSTNTGILKIQRKRILRSQKVMRESVERIVQDIAGGIVPDSNDLVEIQRQLTLSNGLKSTIRKITGNTRSKSLSPDYFIGDSLKELLVLAKEDDKSGQKYYDFTELDRILQDDGSGPYFKGFAARPRTPKKFGMGQVTSGEIGASPRGVDSIVATAVGDKINNMFFSKDLGERETYVERGKEKLANQFGMLTAKLGSKKKAFSVTQSDESILKSLKAMRYMAEELAVPDEDSPVYERIIAINNMIRSENAVKMGKTEKKTEQMMLDFIRSAFGQSDQHAFAAGQGGLPPAVADAVSRIVYAGYRPAEAMKALSAALPTEDFHRAQAVVLQLSKELMEQAGVDRMFTQDFDKIIQASTSKTTPSYGVNRSLTGGNLVRSQGAIKAGAIKKSVGEVDEALAAVRETLSAQRDGISATEKRLKDLSDLFDEMGRLQAVKADLYADRFSNGRLRKPRQYGDAETAVRRFQDFLRRQSFDTGDEKIAKGFTSLVYEFNMLSDKYDQEMAEAGKSEDLIQRGRGRREALIKALKNLAVSGDIDADTVDLDPEDFSTKHSESLTRARGLIDTHRKSIAANLETIKKIDDDWLEVNGDEELYYFYTNSLREKLGKARYTLERFDKKTGDSETRPARRALVEDYIAEIQAELRDLGTRKSLKLDEVLAAQSGMRGQNKRYERKITEASRFIESLTKGKLYDTDIEALDAALDKSGYMRMTKFGKKSRRAELAERFSKNIIGKKSPILDKHFGADEGDLPDTSHLFGRRARVKFERVPNLGALVGNLSPEMAGVLHNLTVARASEGTQVTEGGKGLFGGKSHVTSNSMRDAKKLVRAYFPDLSEDIVTEYAKRAHAIAGELNRNLDMAQLIFGETITREIADAARVRGMKSIGMEGRANTLNMLEENALDEGKEAKMIPTEPDLITAKGGIGSDRGYSAVDDLISYSQAELDAKTGSFVTKQDALWIIEDQLEEARIAEEAAVKAHDEKLAKVYKKRKLGLQNELSKAKIARDKASQELSDMFANVFKVTYDDGSEEIFRSEQEFNRVTEERRAKRIEELANAELGVGEDPKKPELEKVKGSAKQREEIKARNASKLAAWEAEKTALEEGRKQAADRIAKETEELTKKAEDAAKLENARIAAMRDAANKRIGKNQDDLAKRSFKRELLGARRRRALTTEQQKLMAEMHLDDVLAGRSATSYTRKDISRFAKWKMRKDIAEQAGDSIKYGWRNMPGEGRFSGARSKASSRVESVLDFVQRYRDRDTTETIKQFADDQFPITRKKRFSRTRFVSGLVKDVAESEKSKSIGGKAFGAMNLLVNPAASIGKFSAFMKSFVTEGGKGVKIMEGMFGPQMAGQISTGLAAAGPWILIIAAISAVVLILWKTWKKWIDTAKPGIDALKEALKKLWHGVIDPFVGVFKRLGGEGNEQGSVWKNIGTIIGTAAKAFSKIIEVITPFVSLLADTLATSLYIVIQAIRVLVALMTGDWSDAWEGAKKIFAEVWDHMKVVAGLAVLAVIKGVFALVRGTIEGMGMIGNAARKFVAFLNPVGGAGPLENVDSWKNSALAAVDAVQTRMEDKVWNTDSANRKAGEAGKDLGDKIAEATQDSINGKQMDLDPMLPTPDEQAKAAEDATKEFISAFKSQLDKIVEGWKDAALSAFDDWAQAQKDAIDEKVKAIDAEIEAERKRDEDLEYLRRKEELREKRREMNVKYRADRALAIYEGRFDDAKQMDYEHGQSLKDLNREDSDLDRDRVKTLVDRERDAQKERLQIEKDALEKSISLQRKALEAQLDAFTEFTPRSEQAARDMQSKILGALSEATGGYTTIGAENAGAWSAAWKTAMEEAKKQVEDDNYWKNMGQEAMAAFAKELGVELDEDIYAGRGADWTPLPNSGANAYPGGNDAATPRSGYTVNSFPDNPTRYHSGGTVQGMPGEVDATLLSGEYVMQKSAVNKYGEKMLDMLNSGKMKFHSGGLVPVFVSGIKNVFKQFKDDFVSGNLGLDLASEDGRSVKINASKMKQAIMEAASPKDMIVDRIYPAFMSAFNAFNAALGNKFDIVSGFRTYEQQAALYAKYLAGQGNLAAPPGSSMHEFGLAVDTNPNATPQEREIARKYGLVVPIPSEPWHVEPINAKQVRESMKAGSANMEKMYSELGFRIREGLVVPGVPSLDVGGMIRKSGIAEVHKGERVLNAAQTAAYNAGGSTEIHVHIDGNFFGSDREIEKLVSRIDREITPKLNKIKGTQSRTFSKVTH